VALLGASFSIGRSALAAYQAAISIVGQNIANAANADYTRQTGRLTAEVGGPVFGGMRPGAGVRLSELRRHIDEALESRLRLASAGRERVGVIYRSLNQTEALYNELTEQDVSTQLGSMFAGFGAIQTSPQDPGARNLAIAAADTLIQSLRRQRAGLISQVEELNDQAATGAQRGSELAAQIAHLNARIVAEEGGGVRLASALRDQRDAALRELSELMDIHVREQDSGSVNVYVGSEPLVQFDRSRGLTVQRQLDGGLEKASIRFADNNGPVVLREGQLAGALQVRDVYVQEQLDRLDALAGGVIYEVNRIHSTGRGLIGYTSLTGSYAVADADAALNSTAAALDFPVTNGTFIVHVRDKASGQEITRQINVDLDGLNNDGASLNDLAAALDAVPGLRATVTTDNRLTLSADAGFEYHFSEDSSGALAALGVASFLVGTNAATIDVAADVRRDPRLIAASLSGASADGDNAGRLATLAVTASALLGGSTIQEFHAASIDLLAVQAGGALTASEVADAVYSSLVAQRESVSGVSLDEEAINLARYEQAFAGASRYIGVLDNLATEVLSLVG
jgi:flagellar hook-associated protein 1 FlgK